MSYVSFEIAFAAITAITLPVLIVANLFGYVKSRRHSRLGFTDTSATRPHVQHTHTRTPHRMNVPYLPEWDFWPLAGGIISISLLVVVLLLVLWWFAFRNKSKAKAKNKQLKVCTFHVTVASSLPPNINRMLDKQNRRRAFRNCHAKAHSWYARAWSGTVAVAALDQRMAACDWRTSMPLLTFDGTHHTHTHMHTYDLIYWFVIAQRRIRGGSQPGQGTTMTMATMARALAARRDVSQSRAHSNSKAFLSPCPCSSLPIGVVPPDPTTYVL